MRKLLSTLTVAIFIVVILIVGIFNTSCGSPATKKVTVGNKNFTEQYIVGQLMVQLLQAKGYTVNLVSDLSSSALRQGMVSGDIDICADYTGTAWAVYLGNTYTPGVTNEKLYQDVKQADAANGFVWMNAMWNNNTYAMASSQDFAQQHNLNTLSDLAAYYNQHNGQVNTFIDFEYSSRPDGLPALEKFYNFTIAQGNLKTGAAGASLLALENHQTDVAMVFGTDPQIAQYNWHIYTDDKSFFPPYDLAPYVRQEVLNNNPDIQTILNELVATFPGGGQSPTADTISQCRQEWQTLNGQVDTQKMEPNTVASNYLKDKGLIPK